MCADFITKHIYALRYIMDGINFRFYFCFGLYLDHTRKIGIEMQNWKHLRDVLCTRIKLKQSAFGIPAQSFTKIL